jgi:serine/threonine protein kinase
VVCEKHPRASVHDGHCPVCLIEEALRAPSSGVDDSYAGAEDDPEAARRLTIYVPLGSGPSATVFLVRDDRPGGRLLRLKQWHDPAPEGFLARFNEVRRGLHLTRQNGIVLPLEAWVDGAGRPAVLSEFRRGTPILDAVRAGGLDPSRALALLSVVIASMDAAHGRGLAHSSVSAGNVIVHPPSNAACLVDFGMAAAVSPPLDHAAAVRADRDGLAAIARTLETIRPEVQGRRPAL